MLQKNFSSKNKKNILDRDLENLVEVKIQTASLFRTYTLQK